MSRWVRMVVGALLVASACSKARPTDTPPRELRACLDALASTRAFADAELQEVAADRLANVLATRLDAIGAACSPLYKNATCREAVARIGSDRLGATHWMMTCREAYCAELRPRPAACAPAGSWTELQGAIFAHDWGDAAAARMTKSLAARDLDERGLVRLLALFDTKLAELTELDHIPLPILPDEPPRVLVRVALGATAATIRPEDGDEIAVPQLDELKAAVAKLAAAGFPPDRVSVSFSGADATYQQLVSAMDAFLAHSYRDLAVESGADDVPHRFPSEPGVGFDPEAAAILVVAPDDVYVDGSVATTTDTVMDDGGARRLAEALRAAHPTPTVLVLQADKATSMRVITRVLDVARGAGFRDVMFAVNVR